ncbi:MAG: hypothetical protein WBA46_09095 [Thermomicrobiales bacterium]
MTDDRERAERDDDLQTALGLTCARVFGPRIDAEEIDVVELPDDGAVEIQADEWTLHLEGDPLALAFIAIEDEPDQAAAMDAALRIAITPDDLAGMAALNASLDGALVARLANSGDALSQALATLLGATATPSA